MPSYGAPPLGMPEPYLSPPLPMPGSGPSDEGTDKPLPPPPKPQHGIAPPLPVSPPPQMWPGVGVNTQMPYYPPTVPSYGAYAPVSYPSYTDTSIPLQHQQYPQQQGQHQQHTRSSRKHDRRQSHSNNNQTKNDLPESERCTLLCTGIPMYIKEEEILAHFKTFGRVVMLMVTPSDPTAAASATTTTGTGGAGEGNGSTSEGGAAGVTSGGALNGGGDKGGDKDKEGKKVYNECLVQFDSIENAKKCYGSPIAVLNNRFIRITQSTFNIIPLADVPPPTEEELLEIHNIQLQQKQLKAGLSTSSTTASTTASTTTTGGGTTSGVPTAGAPNLTYALGGYTPRPRGPPRGLVPLGKPAKNKKYVAGVTDVASITTTTTTPTKDTSIASSTSTHYASLSVSTDETSPSSVPVPTTEHTDQPSSTEPSISSTVTTAAKTTETPVKKPIVIAPAAAPTKEDLALQSQYDDLRRLRGQVDNIWKSKHALMQVRFESSITSYVSFYNMLYTELTSLSYVYRVKSISSRRCSPSSKALKAGAVRP